MAARSASTWVESMRFYVYLPMPPAAALDIVGGETVEWQLLDRRNDRKRAPHPDLRGDLACRTSVKTTASRRARGRRRRGGS
jgi:hypothetical protein